VCGDRDAATALTRNLSTKRREGIEEMGGSREVDVPAVLIFARPEPFSFLSGKRVEVDGTHTAGRLQPWLWSHEGSPFTPH